MIDVPEAEHQQRERGRLTTGGRRTDDGGRRALLTADELTGFAVRVTSDDRTDPVDPEAESASLPAGVSHLLAADDVLIPGRWGAHITLCGLEVRRPGATAAEHDCDLGCGCVRYCPECVREAARWATETVQPDRASEVR